MRTNSLYGKRVAIYARYSSALQREASIEDQVRRCREHIEREGGTVAPELIFADSATSGASLARPSFERMMKLLDQKPVGLDVIVTEDISRISRDFVDAASVFKHLRYLGVPLIGIADGIDTSAKHAKVMFTMKSLTSDLYLDDLRDKTLRGLEGRCLAGFSTGGLSYGYRSEPVVDNYGRLIGHRILIDEEQANVVRRIFRLYLGGESLRNIAAALNQETVPPPRAKSMHRRKGWMDTTIRAFLHNEAYIGRWSFKRRVWSKVPGTNKRRPRLREEADVMRSEHPDRRIVDHETWEAVQARLASVRACYCRKTDSAAGEGSRKTGHSVSSGRRNQYVLSGLLRCGICGAPMTIHAGTSAHYYRCPDQKKRGTCSNSLALREDVARRRIFGAIRQRFQSPAALVYMRKRIAEHLGSLSQKLNAELAERRARLARVEDRIAGIIEFIATGERSDYVVKTLRDYEAQASHEKATIASLTSQAASPVELPPPEEIVSLALDLEQLLEADPVRGREQLKKLFAGGVIKVTPRPEGYYVAESEFFPFALLTLDLELPTPTEPDPTPSGGGDCLDPDAVATTSAHRAGETGAHKAEKARNQVAPSLPRPPDAVSGMLNGPAGVARARYAGCILPYHWSLCGGWRRDCGGVAAQEAEVRPSVGMGASCCREGRAKRHQRHHEGRAHPFARLRMTLPASPSDTRASCSSLTSNVIWSQRSQPQSDQRIRCQPELQSDPGNAAQLTCDVWGMLRTRHRACVALR